MLVEVPKGSHRSVRHLVEAILLLAMGMFGCGIQATERATQAAPDTNVSEYPLLDRLRSAPTTYTCIEGRDLTPGDVDQLWRLLRSETKELPKLASYLRLAGRAVDVDRMIEYLQTGGGGHLSPQRVPPSDIRQTLRDMISALGWLGARLGESGDSESAAKARLFLTECTSPGFWSGTSIGPVLAQLFGRPPAPISLSQECLQSLGYFLDTAEAVQAQKQKLQAEGVWDDWFEGALAETVHRRSWVMRYKGTLGLEDETYPLCSVHYW
jgi:hypothetical protein